MTTPPSGGFFILQKVVDKRTKRWYYNSVGR
nr:MAG TPA: hypothetical protein [Bacteriophage sp.]